MIRVFAGKDGDFHLIKLEEKVGLGIDVTGYCGHKEAAKQVINLPSTRLAGCCRGCKDGYKKVLDGK